MKIGDMNGEYNKTKIHKERVFSFKCVKFFYKILVKN